MPDHAHNTTRVRYRCARCGEVGTPASVSRTPGWIAIALWGLATALWVATWYVGGLMIFLSIALLGAFIYTLWYFFRRERACRHCGARELEADQEPLPG